MKKKAKVHKKYVYANMNKKNNKNFFIFQSLILIMCSFSDSSILPSH